MLTASGFRHAFFTCVGGVSRGPFATLNLSSSVGDSPASVAENLARAANWLGLDSSKLYWANQVHGNNVIVLDSHSSADSIRSTPGDAIIASEGHLACCVRTADCVPVLSCRPSKRPRRCDSRRLARNCGWYCSPNDSAPEPVGIQPGALDGCYWSPHTSKRF